MTPTCKHCRTAPVTWCYGASTATCTRYRSGKSWWRNYCSRRCAGLAVSQTPEARQQRAAQGAQLQSRNRLAHRDATIKMMKRILGREWRSGDPVEVAAIIRLVREARKAGYHAGWQRWSRV